MDGHLWHGNYAPSLSLESYMSLVSHRFPALAQILWFDRAGADEALARLYRVSNEFETNAEGGRGDSYRLAQRHREVRSQGICSLFALAAGVREIYAIPPGFQAVDVLGGDGLLARVLKTLLPHIEEPVITSDMAGHMVIEALGAGLPAIRQQAQFLFMRDECVDAAILAYGTHHIPRGERLRAYQEAVRILRPGGKLVVHDFEVDAPAARWFTHVVHNYSQAGHSYEHFTAAELHNYFRASGLRDVEVRYMYDPLVIHADLAEHAYALITDYLLEMYGLTEIDFSDHSRENARDAVWKLAQECFYYQQGDASWDGEGKWTMEPVIRRSERGWVAEIPRIALVAVGEK